MMLLCMLLFFFFKQKTAYEMRISDWSSDVCSSDLRARAALAGGDLRFQVGDVERRIACGPVAGGEVGVDFSVAEMAVVDEEEFVEEDAFVFDAFAVGGHRAGGYAAEVGVVAARGDEEGGGVEIGRAHV